MTYRYIVIGLLTLLPLQAMAVEGSIYQQMKRITELEFVLDESELTVQRYLPLLYEDPVLELGIELEEEDVDLLIQNQLQQVCRISEEEVTSYDRCVANAAAEVPSNVKRAQNIRSLGRDLQIIASSYEVGGDGYTGRADSLMSRLPSIINIWQSGVDEMTNPFISESMRGGTWEEEDMEELFSELVEALNALIETDNGKKSYDKIAAAVHRYRHGHQDVIGLEGYCEEDGVGDESNPELEYLTARWCDVEIALQNIYDQIQSTPLTPPAAVNEEVIYPPKILEELGIILWIRWDDAGIVWELPLEPVLPNLISSSDELVEGGRYPPEIEEPRVGEGICSHPFGRRGLLCRPVEAAHCPLDEDDQVLAPAEDEWVINLVSCQPQNQKYNAAETWFGPDACIVGGWRVPIEGANFNNNAAQNNAEPTDNDPGECSNCAIDLRCGGCKADGIGGTVSPKDDDGVIDVCISNNPEVPATYAVLKQLAHAQQQCNLPPRTALYSNPATVESCCSEQWYPSLIMCHAMAEDGNFDDAGISVEQCASIMANKSCEGEFGENACAVVDISDEQEEEIFEAAEQNLKEVPAQCGGAIAENADARITSMRNSITRVCNPNCRVQYENTIGNNLCYISQCLEQTWEEHRVIPGRFAFGVQDESFPWDSCSEENPAYADIVEVPPQESIRIPRYRLPHILKQIDLVQCQLNGLPLKIPLAACTVRPGDGLRFASFDYQELAQQLRNEPEVFRTQVAGVQLNLTNIGARYGTTLYTEIAGGMTDAFAQLLDTAVLMLDEIGETNFPGRSCPRRHTGDCSIFDQ